MAAQFQMVMDKPLTDMDFTICYIDDIVIFSADRKQHIEHVIAVINRLTEYNLPIRVQIWTEDDSTVGLCHFWKRGRNG